MKITIPISERWLVFLSLFGSVLGWGWAWVGIRSAMYYYESGQLALGSYAIATLTLLPFWIKRGAHLPKLHHWPLFIIMGLTGFTFYNFFVNLGEKTVTAGTASLLGSSLPILTTLGAWLFFREKLTLLRWSGIMLAFWGTTITTFKADDSFQFSQGALFILLATVFSTIYGLLVKRMLYYYSSVEITIWSISIGTLGMIPLGHGLLNATFSAPWSATINLVLLGVFPGALCYLLFSFVITRVNMASAFSSMFLLPITSIILSWLLLGELPSWIACIGGTITLFGAYLVNTEKLL